MFHAKEKFIGHAERVVGAVGEAIDTHAGVGAVETLEEAAVEKGNIGKATQRGGVGEARLIAIERGHAVMGVGCGGLAAKAPAAGLVALHLGVERGEEEILQDRLVVGALLRVVPRQQLLQRGAVEERGRHQPLLLDEPDKDQPRDQADDGDGVARLGVLRAVAGREVDRRHRPVIPVRQFLVEALVEFADVEGLGPGALQFVEAPDVLPLAQIRQRQFFQDADVGGVGVVQVDVLDQRHLLQHILAGVAFAGPPQDDRQRQLAAVAEEDRRGHHEEAVDGARDRRQRGARIGFSRQPNRQKKERAIDAAVPAAIFAQQVHLLGLGDFAVGQLKEDVSFGPRVAARLCGVQRAFTAKGGGEVLRAVGRQHKALGAAIAKHVEQVEAGGGQVVARAGGKGGGDLGAEVGGHGCLSVACQGKTVRGGRAGQWCRQALQPTG